ncbi:Prefoldin [Echinococcus multilocularis]|uniref:Prefoldin n=1 Tax=Echinococcus multilocularis TaxID=6211 RepID=A0A068XZH6_ECHMU|nr:Prefoldin [Echinococcus multilocularis]
MFPNTRRASLPSNPAAEAATRRECRTFEPQQWRRSVCKNCFRSEPEHVAAANVATLTAVSVTTTSVSTLESTPVAINAWPVTPALSRKSTSVGSMDAPQLRVGGQPQAPGRRNGQNSQRSPEDLHRGPPTGHRSTPAPIQAPPPQTMVPERSAQAGTSGVFSSASSIDARYVEELENDFFDLEDKYDALARERNDLSMELEAKVRSIEELQTSLEQYKEKVSTLERRCTHLEEEIKGYRERLRLPESDQGGVAGGTADMKTGLSTALEGSECNDDLKSRLNQVEQLCQDVMEENEALKEEIEEMQREIEEMHDHFQEEDRDSMREMQRDLEAANKTCRILQFKLRKAERRFEQVEAERANLEERLSRLESQLYNETDIGHIRTLEEELRVAKEVTVRLNNELDILEEKRQFYEDENHQLKNELQICQNRRIASENEVDRLRLELDKLKYESRFAERGPLQITDKKAGRHSTTASAAPLNTTFSTEQSELVRALQTTKEREADLSEQLRFAEEELRKMNRRMAEAQADNNSLTRQLERLSMQQVRGESPRATASQVKKELAATQQEVKRNEVDENAEKLKAVQEELEMYKETNKMATKRMNQLANEFLTLKVNYREVDWLAKYNDAVESQKDAENKVNTLKRRLADASGDLPSSVVARIESRRPSLKSSDSRAAMSKEWLLQKLDNYDKEMADLETEMSVLRNTANSLKLQSQRMGDELTEFKAEADQREREFREHIEHLEKKDFVISSLLELMVQRTGLLQERFERSKSTELEKSSNGAEAELKNLQQLLEKEREKARILETQLKSGASSIPRPMLSENERARLKEIEALKGQLEEKEEQIEDHESQIRELRGRLERAKKMNEAMKTLIDKDPTDASRASSNTALGGATSPPVPMETKQTALEISSYRREIDSMRKEIAILQQKVVQIEKVREKLLLENKDLQEELKLREDSLFDQDDELEKRNADLAKAKRALELMQVELNEARKGLAAARAQEGMSMKISSTLAENERLKSELRRLEDELRTSNSNLEKAQAAELEVSEKCKQLAQELKNKEALVCEKDDLLSEVKKDSQRLDEELNAARQASTEAQTKVKKLEATIAELQKKFQQREGMGGWRPDSSPDSGIGRDGSRDSRRMEMDRLRRECTALRQERDEIAKEARRDRQMFEKRLQEACNRLNSSMDTSAGVVGGSGVSGDLYSRAVAETQINKKFNLFNELIAKQSSIISQLKIKNEIIQNKALEYQRKYANLKEQYEAEQEAWLSERVVLESKAKEQEERKNTIASTRKSLQETSIRLAEAEITFEKERQRFEHEMARLESEKSDIKVQLTQLKEQQKLPKVLQRFSASPARTGHISMMNTGASTNAANAETARRLDSAERTIARLKSELQHRLEAQSQATIAAIHEAEAARAAAECQMECLNEQLLQLNLYREQAELFRERLIESEQGADREYKIWSEEREDLLCRIEDSRISIEQWCIRLANREGVEGMKSEEIINDIVAEMERWRTCRQHMPVFRRSSSAGPAMLGSHTSDTQSMMGDSMISTPVTQPKAPLSAGHRSTSVEWFNKSCNGFRGSTVSLAAGISSSLARSVTPSLIRCGRSVSPDVSIRKITNYPDPTPGFLVRSRQSSVDNLGSVGDLTQRPFTSPGKPSLRQLISPARRKFFEDNVTPDSGSLVSKTESFTFPLSSSVSSNVIIKHPAELRHSSVTTTTTSNTNTNTVTPIAVVTVESAEEKTSSSPKTSSTPSVLSRISSKLSGSKTDVSRRKSPPKEKRYSPPKTPPLTTSSSKSPKQKKKSPVRTSPLPATPTVPSASTSKAAPDSSTTPKRRGSEMIQSIASKLHSAAESSAKPSPSSLSSAFLKTGRSGSLTSTAISPSIMALRQKFDFFSESDFRQIAFRSGTHPRFCSFRILKGVCLFYSFALFFGEESARHVLPAWCLSDFL